MRRRMNANKHEVCAKAEIFGGPSSLPTPGNGVVVSKTLE